MVSRNTPLLLRGHHWECKRRSWWSEDHGADSWVNRWLGIYVRTPSGTSKVDRPCAGDAREVSFFLPSASQHAGNSSGRWDRSPSSDSSYLQSPGLEARGGRWRPCGHRTRSPPGCVRLRNGLAHAAVHNQGVDGPEGPCQRIAHARRASRRRCRRSVIGQEGGVWRSGDQM